MEFNECPLLASEAVNREHEQLVELINQAEFDVLMGRQAKQPLQALKAFVQQHFAEESQTFSQHAMPHCDAHRRDHEFLLQLIEQACVSNDAEELLSILSDQLPNAIVRHIDRFDRQVVNWLKRHRRSAA